MTHAQEAVFEILKERGPLADSALVPIVQHQAMVHQSSSGIRTRRKELVEAGRVEAVDAIRTPSGREAFVWAVKA